MQDAYSVSRPGSLVCPYCEAGKLYPSSQACARCRLCGSFLSGTMLEALRQIAALPDSSASLTPECGHPRMRLFSNRAVYCLACWS